jgi:hypothetical protein
MSVAATSRSARSRRAGEQVDHRHVAEVQRQLAGVDGGHVQHVVDRARQLRRRGAHGSDVALGPLGQGGPLAVEQLGVADDGGERVRSS